MSLINNTSAQKASAAHPQLSQVAQELQEDVEEAANFAAPPDSDNEAPLDEHV